MYSTTANFSYEDSIRRKHTVAISSNEFFVGISFLKTRSPPTNLSLSLVMGVKKSRKFERPKRKESSNIVSDITKTPISPTIWLTNNSNLLFNEFMFK